jgi:hypothetical protein
MPTTLHGVPYPAPFDVPDVPADLQEIAEMLDSQLQMFVRPAAAATNGTALPAMDAAMAVTLQPGTYRVEAITSYSVPSDGMDVQQAWATSGGITLGSRFVLGAEVAMTTALSTLMSSRPLAAFNTTGSFGVVTTASSYIREELVVTVTATATLTLTWAQNTATAGVLTRNILSHLLVTRLVSAV